MKFAVALAFAVLLDARGSAQHQTFVVDPAASEVKMTLKTTHEVVQSAFHVQSGRIEFDRSAPKMSGSMVVLAGSGNTGSGMRDKRMNKEILQVERYATVSFEPKSYAGAVAVSGDSTVQVTGTFTLLGTPHEITVPMLLHAEGATMTAKGHLTVPYVQWGLRDPSLLIWKAEKEVLIDLVLAGQLSK